MLLPLPVQNSITETGMARQIRKKSGAGVYFGVIQKLKNDQ